MLAGMHHDTLYTTDIDPAQATPMVRQFLEVKQQYPGILLLYQMGDFYETFFEDALITARALEITLTARDAGGLGKIPMAGIPIRALDGYLTKLLAANFKVAICDQAENPQEAKGLVKRRVVRVLSKGTLTEGTILASRQAQHLVALCPAQQGKRRAIQTTTGALFALAWCDVTTGAFETLHGDALTVAAELDRLSPSELLVPGHWQADLPDIHLGNRARVGRWVPAPSLPEALLSPWASVTTALSDADSTLEVGEKALKTLFQLPFLDSLGLTDSPAIITACGLLARYLQNTFLDDLPHFDRIVHRSTDHQMRLSANTRRNLELVQTSRTQQEAGSLLSVLDQTLTSMGARLLRQWVLQPLTHLPEIHARHETVAQLVNHPTIRQEASALLKTVYDLERLAMRVANRTATPRELLALKESVAQLPQLAVLLKPLDAFYLVRLHDFPPELFKAVSLIEQAIAPNPGQSIREGSIIAPGYHTELDHLRQVIADHTAWIAAYEAQEREATGIKSLKVVHSSTFGYTIDITKANLGAVPETYQRKQTLANAERFTTDVLKREEQQYVDALARQNELEYNLFLQVRDALVPYAPTLLDCAQRVAAFDALLSLAQVAVAQGYCRPVVDDSLELVIHGGRHPVIETRLPMGQFVPNDCHLTAQRVDDDPHLAPLARTPQVLIITGPNMAGKSTVMRQVAVITLMAQMGSFVPASYARIGLVDAIDTRVGAVDDLASGQSTFMVEMVETAAILNHATHRSLVILDEVGRGTSTYDGVSIAWAICEHLATAVGARTLFATHYHELNGLEANWPSIHNARVGIAETAEDGRLTIHFLHKLEAGTAQKSYGIQVARLAGLPERVIGRAETLLNRFEREAEKQALSPKPLKATDDADDAATQSVQVKLRLY